MTRPLSIDLRERVIDAVDGVCPVALLLSGLAFPSLRRSNGYSVGARRGTGGHTLKAGITAPIALKPMPRRFSRL